MFKPGGNIGANNNNKSIPDPSASKCPYCEEPSYLLLSTSMLISDRDNFQQAHSLQLQLTSITEQNPMLILNNNLQPLGSQANTQLQTNNNTTTMLQWCCCQPLTQQPISMTGTPVPSNHATAQQLQQAQHNTISERMQGSINQMRSNLGLRQIEAHQLISAGGSPYIQQRDSNVGISQQHQLINDITQQQMDPFQMQHATMEVMFSEQNLNNLTTQQLTREFRAGDAASIPSNNNQERGINFNNNHESRLSFSEFDADGTYARAPKSQRLIEEGKIAGTPRMVKIVAGMHILKTTTEKVIDSKQRPKEVQVLYLGDAHVHHRNHENQNFQKHRAGVAQNQTLPTASNTNHRQTFASSAAAHNYLGAAHSNDERTILNDRDTLKSYLPSVQQQHQITPACCQMQHFLPPEADPQYRPDKAQCKHFNKLLMRHIVDQKMKKNKSFFECKLLPNAQVLSHQQSNLMKQQKQFLQDIIMGGQQQSSSPLNRQRLTSPRQQLPQNNKYSQLQIKPVGTPQILHIDEDGNLLSASPTPHELKPVFFAQNQKSNTFFEPRFQPVGGNHNSGNMGVREGILFQQLRPKKDEAFV